MTGGTPLLDRPTIERIFRRLGERLSARGVVADLYVFGGAAMAVAYDARRATRDVDALFMPHDHPGLRVSAASPEHLLAMKVLAARRRDAEDIAILVKHLGLSSSDDVLVLCAEIFPTEPVPDRARLVLDDVFGRK